MKITPSIDKTFKLKKALEADGFSIDEREGESFAHGSPYENYGEIWVAFKLSFGKHSLPIDMKVYQYSSGLDHLQETLYEGIAPTNQQDYDTLMQLLFPSKDFVRMVESSIDVI